MITRKTALPVLALAMALAGGTALSTVPIERAAAQAATAPQPTQQQHERHRLSPSQRVEGRIAYLKAELKITNAQEPQFDRVAQAMRDNAKAMEQAFTQMHGNRGQPQNAVEHLETRSRFATLRAQASQRYLDAFKPLYASLSDQQKQTADELLASHHHHHRHG